MPTLKNKNDALHGIGMGEDREALRLLPGLNVVSAADLAVIRKIPLVQQRIENGEYIVDERASVGDSLKELQEETALSIVAETLDRVLLARWKERETRAHVIAACEKQLALVKPDVKKAEK